MTEDFAYGLKDVILNTTSAYIFLRILKMIRQMRGVVFHFACFSPVGAKNHEGESRELGTPGPRYFIDPCSLLHPFHFYAILLGVWILSIRCTVCLCNFDNML